MKGPLLAVAAAAGLLCAAPALAADAKPIFIPTVPLTAAPSGYLEFYGQVARQDYWGTEYNPWRGFGGAGRLNFWTAANRSVQFDFAGQVLTESYSPNYYWSGSLYGATHLSHRSDRGLWGGFFGVAGTSDYEGYYGIDFSVFGGLEAQHYMGPVTLYGQVGGITQVSGYSETFTYFFAQGEVRYYHTPNTKFSANIGVTTGSIWSGSTETYLTYAAEVEHKFPGIFSAFARVEGFNGSGYYDINGHKLIGGFKVHLGTQTLLDVDRQGATLKVMNDLATVGDFRGFD